MREHEHISLDELGPWIEERLSEKYRPGLNRLLQSFEPAMQALALIECNLLDVGGFLGTVTPENCLNHGEDQSSYETCRYSIDRVLHSMDFVSSFPSCADYISFCRFTRLCKELKDALTSVLKTLNTYSIGSCSQCCADAIEKIIVTLPYFSAAVSNFEQVLEESRHFTEHLGSLKERILGKQFSSIFSERSFVLEAKQAMNSHIAARSRYEGAKQQAEALCTDPRLKEIQRLEAERDELASGMDAVLSPFVRISHNLQGKGGTLVAGGDLTPDEAACVRKYTGILVRADLYELLEEEGAIENLLEALFLLGIASGVGADVTPMPSAATAQVPQRPPPPVGLSRKSQALLTDALNTFQADKLRCGHDAWRDRRRRLAELESCTDYQSRRASAAAAASAFLEEAKALDSIARRAREAEERGHRAATLLAEFQEHVRARYVCSALSIFY